ncbi:DUF7222 domain-containing protein [Pontimicrobium sp. MEBiC01747]
MTNNELKNKLQDIATETENTLKKVVIDEILSNYEDEIETGFHNIICYHRTFGMVDSFIFYVDMQAFFDTHYEWIHDAILDYEDRYGIPFNFQYKDDIKSELAWVAFQETANQMAYELGLEV